VPWGWDAGGVRVQVDVFTREEPIKDSMHPHPHLRPPALRAILLMWSCLCPCMLGLPPWNMLRRPCTQNALVPVVTGAQMPVRWRG
jgi:hypothetical protein